MIRPIVSDTRIMKNTTKTQTVADLLPGDMLTGAPTHWGSTQVREIKRYGAISVLVFTDNAEVEVVTSQTVDVLIRRDGTTFGEDRAKHLADTKAAVEARVAHLIPLTAQDED